MRSRISRIWQYRLHQTKLDRDCLIGTKIGQPSGPARQASSRGILRVGALSTKERGGHHARDKAERAAQSHARVEEGGTGRVPRGSVGRKCGDGARAQRRFRARRRLEQSKAVEAATPPIAAQTFIPLVIASPTPPTCAEPWELRIELRRSALVATVSWPMSATAECAGWLRALPR